MAVLALGAECGGMECDVIAGDGYPYKEPSPTLLSLSFLTQ